MTPQFFVEISVGLWIRPDDVSSVVVKFDPGASGASVEVRMKDGGVFELVDGDREKARIRASEAVLALNVAIQKSMR